MEQKFVDGINIFVQRIGATLTQQDEDTFLAAPPGEEYPIYISTDYLGIILSYTTLCGVLPSPSLAATLVQNNAGGVEGTCFYFSVQLTDGEPWLLLETRQFVLASTTEDDIAAILGRCWRLTAQAKESLNK